MGYVTALAADSNDRIGHVTACMDEAADLLTIEAAVIPGKGKLVNTSLGDVMQESIQAAMTVVRARAERLGISDQEFYQRTTCIHVPEGYTERRPECRCRNVRH